MYQQIFIIDKVYQYLKEGKEGSRYWLIDWLILTTTKEAYDYEIYHNTLVELQMNNTFVQTLYKVVVMDYNRAFEEAVHTRMAVVHMRIHNEDKPYRCSVCG